MAPDIVKVESKEADAEQLLARARSLSQRVAQCLRREEAEHDELSTQVKHLQLAIKDAQKLAKQGSDAGVVDILQQASAVVGGQGPGGDLKRFLGAVDPKLLQLLLGKQTCVVAWSTRRSMALKQEYHEFRNRCANIMALFSATLLLGFLRAQRKLEAHEDMSLTPPLIVGLQLFLIWLLFFYTSSALRENVLMVNGSHIRPWWIQHHYWSIFTCFLLLSLPVDSQALSKYATRHLFWTCLQSIVMIVQNRYQRRRMYTRIALGKNNAMDVVGGESSAASGQLLLLYPLVFVLQGLQVWIGLEMMLETRQALTSPEGWLDLERHESDLWGTRGVFLTGFTMLFMGVQNFRNTVLTILDKKQFRKRMRAKAGAQQRQQAANATASLAAAKQ